MVTSIGKRRPRISTSKLELEVARATELLAKFATGEKEQGTSVRRPLEILEDASTGATPLFPSAVELWKKSTGR